MSVVAAVDDLQAGYEALRAEVTGGSPAVSPRGLALVLAHGLPAWIRAWASPPPVAPSPAPAVARDDVTGKTGAEIVWLLTEMALGARKAVAVS